MLSSFDRCSNICSATTSAGKFKSALCGRLSVRSVAPFEVWQRRQNALCRSKQGADEQRGDRFSKRGALHELYNPAFSVNSDFTGPPDIGETNMARSQKIGRFRLRHGPTHDGYSRARLS
jgi:hypothetical protein